MNDATLAATDSQHEDSHAQAHVNREGALGSTTIVVAATFTADLLHMPLQFWMRQLQVRADVTIAPYGQVMQELLNPQSLFARNRDGFNILLIRLDDWIRDRQEEPVEVNVSHLRRTAGDLLNAISSLRRRTSVPLLIAICPCSSLLPLDLRITIDGIERDLHQRLSAIPYTHCWTHADLMRLYEISEHEDIRADRLGHIPYRFEYFVVLATVFARHLAAVVKPRYKVIAIDCDNTLWRGICGEDGAEGIELTPAHLALQRMLLQQHDAGMLLCLCSKNNVADVEAVWRLHPDMPLREEHLVASRVNWDAKSNNLQSLAQELDLALDSFILIDDSAMECAEVREHCPSVLTLQLPQREEDITHFLAHTWAFDRTGVTQEARQRTELYRQNRARSKALQEATDFEQFLASLDLRVEIASLQPEQLGRVAELVQRTNQFNLTSIRRRADEIQALCGSGELRCLVIHVRDRFGDYGLVGTVLWRCSASSLVVDTFLLSCRVLGRGVEELVVRELGELAARETLSNVVFHYRSTPRNTPARILLERLFSQFCEKSDDGLAATFIVPIEYLAGLTSRSEMPLAHTDNGARASGANHQAVNGADWHHAAYRLSRIADIVDEINRSTNKTQRDSVARAAPRTPVEQAVAEIWADVLGISEVGVCDDFFELGGDSLRAIRAIAAIGSVLGLDLSVYEFFEAPTVQEVARKLTAASAPRSVIEAAPLSGPASLSPAQQRLWFIDRLEGGSPAYHIPLALRMRGHLDDGALRSALDAELARHESLRTTFTEINGEPLQQVMSQARFALRTVDLGPLAPSQREEELLRQSHDELAAPFDLKSGPLIRGRLLRMSDDEHVLLITMHHIISDGWSIGVLFRDLGSLYEGYRTGKPSTLQPLPIQYADYARWQRQSVASAETKEHLAYWVDHLRGAPELLELPADRPRPAVQSYRGAEVRVALGAELTTKLRDLARHNNATLAMVLCAAWSIVLSRVSGQADLVLGMPMANRRRTELENLIGFFVNTLPIRVRLDGDPSVVDLLRNVRDAMVGAYEHQDVPFEQVVEALQPVRSLSHHPVFQVVFVLQNTPRGALQLRGLSLLEHEVPQQTAQFDLSLALQETCGEVVGHLNYATDLYDCGTIERLVGYYKAVLAGMVEQAVATVGKLPLMHEEERQHVLELFNRTQAEYPSHVPVHKLFEEQVLRDPDAVAVVDAEGSVTYAALNARANRLARLLRSCGMQSGEYVPISMTRSLQSVIAQLAVLKCGGVYVPVDPDLPAPRRSFMIRDCGAQRILIDGAPAGDLADPAVQSINCGEAAGADSGPPAALGPPVESGAPAYVMYTSGSTGVPKGVVVPHRAIVRLAINNGYAPITSEDCIAHHSNPAFDASTFEVWGALLNGARILILPQSIVLEAARFAETLERGGVTMLYLSVGLFNQYVSALAHIFPRLRYLLVGGDAVEPATIRRVLRNCPPQHLLNAYGPTECTTFTTTHLIEAVDEMATRIPIGRPIANARTYILDVSCQPVPIGVVGEIYIGGAGVACGYMNRPELTAERFLPDTFSEDASARMYKTGDLGRWRADGTIDYLGRNDQQVKIRGFRIELGEIETQLLRHEQVHEAVVVAREDVSGEKRLVAYVTPSSGSAPRLETLRDHLKDVLPEYMVPSAVVLLERMPLTSTGKLDRRALPVPQLDDYARRIYEPPRGEVEEILAGIWQALLKLPRVGRRDNFFELGGHSLLIVQMLERLRRVGLWTEVRRVFESPTLAALASALTRDALGDVAIPPNGILPNCTEITPQMLPLVALSQEHLERIVRAIPGGAANIQDIYPLAPLQEGILFHHLLDKSGDIYVLSTMFEVSSPERVDQLRSALQSVIDRHDVLRTAVLWEQLPQPLQVVCRRATLPVEHVSVDPQRAVLAQLMEHMQPERQRLDLRCAPLIRLKVVPETNAKRCYVLLQLHHIVADGQALKIVVSEVLAHLSGDTQHLAEAIPYRNHVAQSLAYAATHDSAAFFRNKLADVDEPTAPFGLLDVHADGSRLEEADCMIEAELAWQIRAQARRLGVSAATVFHAAWSLVIAHTSGREDVVFGSVLLGRLQGSSGAQQILGMFINTLPLRVRLNDVTARGLIEQVQKELIELLSHEQASLAVAQACSGVRGAAPLFSALLNYRHSADAGTGSWSRTEGIRVIATRGFTNYPITISVDDLDDAFSMTAQTDRRVDPRRMTRYLHAAVRSLVEALEHEPQAPALALTILPQEERLHLIERLNATRSMYPGQKLIHQLFEEQVQRTPDAIAVMHQAQVLTYEEIDRQANRLAQLLIDRGVRADRLVAICMERSVHMVVGLLAILKAGGAYVPLDPNYPPERLHYMVQDAAPQVVLTQERLQHLLPDTDAEVIVIDTASYDLESRANQISSRIHPSASPDNLVYVIYTSGSTGRPKGTAMSHAAMVNLIEWHRRSLPLTSTSRVLQFAAMSFDVAFQEVFSTLCTGGVLTLPDEWVRRDARALLELLSAQVIERLFVPPLMLQSLAECFDRCNVDLVALRDVITAGEQLRISPEIVRFFERLGGCRLHNHYGPTETHVVTALTLSGDPQSWPTLPTIGQPISNTQIYVLDGRRQPVPLGAAGEIYIAGDSVARGYLNRPDLTTERFLRDPFSSEPHARMYKSGDVGRWREDGTLEYLGRNDDQVKIRGFRVELGEVEAQLAQHPLVKQATAVVREGAARERRLVAYVTRQGDSDPTAEELRSYVKGRLPEHMVPSAFVVLEQMPITASGKVNRRALPAPEITAFASRPYESPLGAIEEALARVWQELLRVQQVGRQDDFFDLGGHSLIALQMIGRVQTLFSIEMPIRLVFDFPTLEQLSRQVSELCRLRLLNQIAEHGTQAEELLDRVALMPESEVQDLLSELTMGGGI